MTIVILPGGWVDVRALTGHDENALFDADQGGALIGALTLIDRLLIDRAGALVTAGQAASLTSAARDRLLAALYQHIYGERVASSPTCHHCGEKFDLSFALPDLLNSFPVSTPHADGLYRTSDGIAFRLPTGLDELAIIGMDGQAARLHLLNACVNVGGQHVDAAAWSEAERAAVEAAMEQAAPLINVDLTATCPECGAAHKIRFDIGAYLIGRLLNDKTRLAGEVHALAVSYHWGLNEILSLSRAERGRYLALIQADANRARLRATPTGSTRRRIG